MYTYVSNKHVLIGCKHDLFCPPNIRSLEQAAVVDLIRFRSTKYSLQELLDVKLLSGGKCTDSEREICLKVEKNEI